jgi:hypothetical protein
MNKSLLSIAVFTTLLPLASTAWALDLSHFIDCVGPNVNGYGLTCPLDAGTNTLTTSSYGVGIWVTRAGVTIKGTSSVNPGGTVLQRGPTNTGALLLLAVAATATGVTIQDMEFDGNRSNIQMTLGHCVWRYNGDDPGYYDLNFSYPSSGTVNNVWFVNAPETAVIMGSGQTLENSWIGANGTSSASRTTGVFVGSNSTVQNNYIYYAGTAAVTTFSQSVFIYGNSMYMNRYEGTYDGPGGVVDLDIGSSYATVAYNYIDQEHYAPSNGTINGCTSYAAVTSGAVEISGSHHILRNNDVLYAGTGYQVGGPNSTSDIYMTGNPYNFGESSYYLQASYAGINIRGNTETCNGSACPAVQNVTLDHLRTYYNTAYEVRFGGGATGTGFENSQCISPSTGVQVDGTNSANTSIPSTSCP